MSTFSPEKAKSRPTEIQGYAIVSDDNKIAGPDGLVPASLRNENGLGLLPASARGLGSDRVRPSQPRTRA